MVKKLPKVPHRRRGLLAALASAALVMGAATASAAPPAQVETRARTRIVVAAAASLKPAAHALKAAFEAARPEVEVALTFGASGAFFAQAQQGAPFDLLLSADREYPARLVAAGLARAEEEKVYAFGRLVAWRAPGVRVDLEGRGLAALADPGVRRIAIANPAVAPFGRAAEAALRAAGVLEAVRGRLVLGASAAQAAQFATTGAAEVALLPRSLTLEPALAEGRPWPLPAALHPGLPQSGVVLAAARAPAAARDFLAFTLGEAGRAILQRHGLDLP